MSERLDASLGLDLMSTAEIVRLIQSEDAKVPSAVEAAAGAIASAIDAVTDRLANGGRLFYVGAGTSGRIAFLDAAELPPTFGVAPDLVQVILAGGETAFVQAVEGAEDDEDAAIAEIGRRVASDDCVVGIAASGTTPFTVAAVRRANMLGALTIGVTSRRNAPLAQDADIAIVVETGPEVIMGSSRMKSGTAQKLVLNTLSTGVMVRLGRIHSNLMVDMPPTNEKLRARAVTMVELAAKVPRPQAAVAMKEADGNVRVAAVMARRRVSRDEAERILAEANGRLREALGD